jgi:hypothetical protein
MSEFELTPTRLLQGVWEGVLTSKSRSKAVPVVRVTHLEADIAGVEVKENAKAQHWLVRIPIPVDAISDGVQTFLIDDAKSGERLGQFCLIAGEALGDDLRAEIDLLRAELDMLKRAFRRHCLETT